ncbi:MAG: cysteine dioxygenase family protein [Planctomycetota bacterium]
MPSTAASGLNIHAWIEGLEAIPRDGSHTCAVGRFVRSHPISRESLTRYAFFHAKHYTRNLIHLSETFEVLALCWGPGHASTVHNHRLQNCWVAMADGRLESLNFEIAERDAERGTCKLRPTTSDVITRAAPYCVQEVDAIHQIVNCPSREEPALSVHVYSKPFDTCEVYCLQTGTFKDVKLSYWSIRGELHGRATLDCI